MLQVALQRRSAYEACSKEANMSTAQLVQIIITLTGIALAVVVLLWGPFGMLVDGIIAFVIFVAAGMAAAFSYAVLMRKG